MDYLKSIKAGKCTIYSSEILSLSFNQWLSKDCFQCSEVWNLQKVLNKRLNLQQWAKYLPFLELRQYKNDSIWSKNKLGLKLARFFTRLFGEWKARQIQI